MTGHYFSKTLGGGEWGGWGWASWQALESTQSLIKALTEKAALTENLHAARTEGGRL